MKLHTSSSHFVPAEHAKQFLLVGVHHMGEGLFRRLRSKGHGS
jgi:hypothetical protein